MVQLNQLPGNYTLRAASTGLNQKVSGYGYMSYQVGGRLGGSQPPVNVQPYIDYGGTNTTANVTAFNINVAAPLIPDPPSPTADATHFLALNRLPDAWEWTLNGSLFGSPLELVTPLLFDPDSALPNLAIKSNNNTWVDIVMTLTGLQPPSNS